MQIDGEGTTNAVSVANGRIAQTRVQDSAATAEATERPLDIRDQVQLSAEGRIRARSADVVRATPEVRADVVQSLRAAIADGTYESDPARLAARLIHSGVMLP